MQDLCFGGYRLDPRNECLWIDGRMIQLQPRTYAVLAYLAAHSGRMVTKAELLDHVWLDLDVGDAVLKTAINVLRRILDDCPHAPRFIQTLHRRGYRFIAPVTVAQARPEPRPVLEHFIPVFAGQLATV